MGLDCFTDLLSIRTPHYVGANSVGDSLVNDQVLRGNREIFVMTQKEMLALPSTMKTLIELLPRTIF